MKNKIKQKFIPTHDLEKIPDKELLRLSQQEVGKLRSHVDELEYEIKKLKKELQDAAKVHKLSEEERKRIAQEVKKEKLWKNMITENKALRERLRKADILNSEYITRIVNLQSFINNDYSNVSEDRLKLIKDAMAYLPSLPSVNLPYQIVSAIAMEDDPPRPVTRAMFDNFPRVKLRAVRYQIKFVPEMVWRAKEIIKIDE